MRIWIFKGQIAVFLVLLMALIFLFVVITMNIGQFSQEKTMVSQAADGAVLLHASLRSSYGRACWNQIRSSELSDASPVQEHKPGAPWEHANVDWKAVVILPAAYFIAIISHQYWIISLGHASLALKQLAIDPMLLRAQNRILQGFMKSLPSNLQMVENAIGYALAAVVDDPNQVEDSHDINQNGDTKDKVLAFANWRAENLAALIGGNEQPKLDLRDKINAVLPAFENFRRYLGGIALEYTAPAISNSDVWWREDYPEFDIFHDEWMKEYHYPTCVATCNKADYAAQDNQEIDYCEAKCRMQSEGLTPQVRSLLQRPINPYYPQDSYPQHYPPAPEDGFMRLLADFEAVNLPRDGYGEKDPFKIKNVNVSDFDAEPYTENLGYDFKFWEREEVPEGQPMSSLRYNYFRCLKGLSKDKDLLDSYPVAYYWNSAPFGNYPELCPDNVDYLIELLEGFHFFAYGGHQVLWDWNKGKISDSCDQEKCPKFSDSCVEAWCPKKLCCYPSFLTWVPGVASYTLFDAQRNFSTWVRTLVNLDDYAPPKPSPSGDEQPTSTPEEIEVARVARYRDTLMAQVELLLKMIGPPYGQWVDGYGWWGDLDNILKANAPNPAAQSRAYFFGAGSDVAGNPAYKGLNGKRQELRDKMDAVCNKLKTTLVPDFNSNLSGPVPLICCTCQGSVANATQGLDISCNGYDTTVADIDDMITAINTRKTEIETAQVALARANTNCQGCCESQKTTCKNAYLDCRRRYDNCYTDMINSKCAPTAKDRPLCCLDYTCCDNILKNCIDNCDGPYNSCIASCNSTFVPPQNDRAAELTKLDTILSYAQKFKLLAQSLEKVEALISRVNEAQARIKSFWNVANEFYCSIMEQSYLEQLWDVDNGKAPDQPEVQVIYSWKTKNVLAKDALDPEHPPIRHYVRVTASNPPMPVLKAKKFYWGFGKGAEILHPEGDVWVKVERFDEDKALSLGGKGFNWLNWLYHTSHPPKDPKEDQRTLAKIKEQNLDEYDSIVDKDHPNWDPNRLFKYAVGSYAKAKYSPRLYRTVDKDGNTINPSLETYITEAK